MRCPRCHTDNTDTARFCCHCAAPLTADARPTFTQTMETPREELSTGSTFAGRYQIIEELGSGGMGRVYKAFDTEIREKVALKLISPQLAADENTITRFRNELKLARNISHQHVCRMYDLNREAGTYYMTMEYIAGEDLKNMIRMSRQMTVGTAIGITRQICEGLAEAHKQGIVHRDLKPNNIMMDRKGRVRIMDFGIARTAESKGITGRGTMIGTPEYMSPEQVEGKEVDHRSDIYSLGIILYEMLTGRLPFEGDTALSVGIKHKSETPADPCRFNPRIPADLSTLILKCLAKAKEARFQNAMEIDAELARIVEGLPTAEKPAAPKKSSKSKTITVQFSPKKVIIPALGIIAMLIGAFLVFKPRFQSESVPTSSDKPSLAVVYFENNTGRPELDHWRSGLCELLITDLSQSRFLHVMSGDRIYTMLEEMDLLERGKFNTRDLRRIAARGGVNHVLRGNYMTAGNKFIINISLLEAETGAVVRSLREESLGEENITNSVDHITTSVKTALDLTPRQLADDIDKDVGLVTTRSPEAYRCFIEGIQYDIKGDYPKVVECMRKAVAADPEFASAYHVMSWAYSNQGYGNEQEECLRKALELSERLSDRERYMIQGDYAMNVENDNIKAEQAFRKLVELYPDDISGHNFLGIVNIRLGNLEKANHHYAKAIELGTEDVVIYANLASSYRAMGLFNREREVLESYVRKFGDSPSIRRYVANSYGYEGRFDEAFAELDKAGSLAPADFGVLRAKAGLYLHVGDLTEAESIFRQLMERPDVLAQGWGFYYMFRLCQRQGRFEDMEEFGRRGMRQAEEAGQKGWVRNWLSNLAFCQERRGRPQRSLEIYDKVIRIDVKDTNVSGEIESLYGRGLALVGLKNYAAAQETADEINKKIEAGGVSRTSMYQYYMLLGRIAFEKKHYARAIESYEQGQKLLHPTQRAHMRVLDELGRAAYRAGNLERARQEYTRLIRLNFGRLLFGDIYVKAHYMLGVIHQELGNRAEAVAYFEKFLDMWKDADPDIPELADAHSRLDGVRHL